MNLTPGAKLGPYEIAGALGAGGMGEVYRAKDTRLGRDVAVKLIPAHLSQDPEVRERFEREARVISSLNHPNICTLYDVGRDGDTEFFVMELLEGESLAARLERGALRPDEALKYAAQIADALAAAHKQGIVHRDLKPANVVLTKTGAKILDFGIAKLREEQVVDMATRTTPLTSAGAMVGTVQYMAPEQLEGKPVDHRADLFAFGALLFEMLTGKRAFDGQSQASVIAAILTAEPRAVSEIAPASPPAVDRIVKLCLAKDPDERWQSAGDLARELKWIAEGKSSPSTGPVAVVTRRSSRREILAWTLAVVFLAGLLALALRSRPASAPKLPTTHFTIVPPKGQIEGSPVLSPDGRFVVYVLNPDTGTTALWLHSLETGTARLLPGTDGARQPFWSPDGQSIAFFTRGRLMKTTRNGDPPMQLCDAADSRGGSWGSGGDILFSPGSAAGLYRVSAAGGTPSPATRSEPNSGERSHRMPAFLPDGRHFLFTCTGQPEKAGVYWTTLGGTERKRVLPDVTAAKYDERGYIVFRRGGALMAQRFDTERGELSGEAVALTADVGTDAQITSLDLFSISNHGVFLFRTGSSQQVRLAWTDRTGKTLGIVAPDHSLFEPTISPDETKLAAAGQLGNGSDSAIWVADLRAGGQISRLTFDKGDTETASWSSDGRYIHFTESREGGWAIARKASDGTGAEESLYEAHVPVWADGASPDGRWLIVEQYEPETGSDLWLVPLGGVHTPVPYRKTPRNETHAAFSPDSRYLAYVSDEQGVADVFVETVPPSGSRWQVSSGGGDQPIFRADGKALYYMSTSRMLTEVDIKSFSPLTLGAQRPLFRLSIPTVSLTGPRSFYAPTRNGEKFIVDVTVGDAGSPGFDVVLNWDLSGNGK